MLLNDKCLLLFFQLFFVLGKNALLRAGFYGRVFAFELLEFTLRVKNEHGY